MKKLLPIALLGTSVFLLYFAIMETKNLFDSIDDPFDIEDIDYTEEMF